MPPSLFIALRFIGYRKKAIILSLTGVVLGVAFYICAQAQTQGFEQYFIKSALDTSGALIIMDRFQPRYTGLLPRDGKTVVSVNSERARKYYEGISNADQIMRVVREFSNVTACAPVLEGNVGLRADFQQEVIRVQGVDLGLHLKATALQEQIIAGSLEEFRVRPGGLILGEVLARRLRAQVGQDVALVGPDGEAHSFHVCAIFQCGVSSIDERRGIIHLKAAQSLLHKPFGVSLIMVKLRDPARAPQLAAHLEQLLHHRVQSWQDREKGNLQIFRTLRISAALTVSTTILLAGFGIFNILTLMVLDKVREIAVLRSMGYRRSDISAVFLWQGLLVALIGSVLGCVGGAVLTFAVSKIPVHIRGLLRADTFLVHWSLAHYVVATMMAFVAVFLASYFPSRRAARLAPVSILRGSGQ